MRSGFLFVLGLFFLPFLVSADVVINEVAWMGTEVSYADEWIELYNNSTDDVDLTGWILSAEDGTPNINIVAESCISSCIISAGGFFLLERTDDTSVPNISADLIYTGVLSNSGEVLILKNDNSSEIDKTNTLEDLWPAGNNETKETMQKFGSGWITATGTPKAQNAGQEEEEEQREQEEFAQSPGNIEAGEYIPPDDLPKIKAYAGKDKRMTVGASAEFRGEAFGFDNEPLENARYLWNFGDGSLKEGQNITHFYQYLGEYLVVLDVSSGEYSASDTVIIKVVPNEIFISEVKTGVDSFIELKNESKNKINISGWRFGSGYQNFTFSKNSFIRPNSYLVIPVSVSDMILHQGKGTAELLYPGGFLADSFNYNGVLLEGQSFSREGESSAITIETPGAKNNEPMVPVVAEKSKETADYKPIIKNENLDNNKNGEVMEENGEILQQDNQAANFITITNDDSGRSKKLVYFFGALALAILAGLGVFLIRRQRRV